MQPTTDPDLSLPARADAPGASTDPPVLQTEDCAEFARMLAGFQRDVEPRGALEEMYVSDIAWIVWEMLCLRRYRAALINSEFCGAVATVARNAMMHSGEPVAPDDRRPSDLARRWFSDPAAREEMRTLLRRFNLDETTIEATAINRVGGRIAALEKRQAALEARRDKALSGIARFRADFARQVRASLDRIIGPAADEVRREIVESAVDDIRRLYQTGELLRMSDPA